MKITRITEKKESNDRLSFLHSTLSVDYGKAKIDDQKNSATNAECQRKNMKIENIKTLGDLKKAGYQSKSIKDELRDNLRKKIKAGENVFVGIWGYEDSVIPELERAILSRHNINLLGLRGQAKTRLARLMVNLLDEYVPFVEGSEIHDDPFFVLWKHNYTELLMIFSLTN